MADCLFCKIAAGTIPAKLVHQDESIVAFRDLNPQAPVHILVIPRKHVATVNDLDDADAELVGKMVVVARDLAKAEAVAASGFRLVMNTNAQAGQSVFHIHMHLLGGRFLGWPPG
jgi:histidine triad (HIT) family protein